jgi:2,4-dienoyl-CoA reductase (NADPH2)
VYFGAAKLSTDEEAAAHLPVTAAVHREGGRIAMQILHAGRYAYHGEPVAPSPLQAPINPSVPHELSDDEVEQTIEAFVRSADLARSAGYDGVEIMGSEGYLINEFVVAATNRRTDRWGGEYEDRIRFPVEIVRRVREQVGPEFIIVYRLSMLDLVPGGSTLDEVITLARAVEAAGATIINTGIGWHEARIPTIATVVPRGAYAWATRAVMGAVGVPLVTTNRINTPEVAERLLAEGYADMVSLARPFLADPDFVAKARSGRADLINTCIGCNQACLDHTFTGRVTSCLVNPRACHETELVVSPTPDRRRVAVVGAGPAGLACAVTAAQRGHEVTLFDAAAQVGGQLNLARRIPGKEEFDETLRYFRAQLAEHGVDVRLNTRATAQDLDPGSYDEIVLATGVTPRLPDIPGVEHSCVLSYLDVLRDDAPVGNRVAVIGAGGIGFDVAVYLTAGAPGQAPSAEEFLEEWGIDPSIAVRGGLLGVAGRKAARKVYLLQRKPEKPGRTLGLTTGWAIRAELERRGVETISGCRYERIDDAGLHIRAGGAARLLEVDTVVICAGQESERGLYDELRALGAPAELIGGAQVAAEIDALRAIEQGTRLALAL